MLRRLTEAASDLVFLDLPCRLAKLLLIQHRGSNGSIRHKVNQEELAHQARARGRASMPRAWLRETGRIEVHDRAVTGSRRPRSAVSPIIKCQQGDSGGVSRVTDILIAAHQANSKQLFQRI
jgi:hypothetical protein